MSDPFKERAQKKDMRMGKVPLDSGNKPNSISTMSNIDDPLHNDENSRIPTENTYQLGPYKRHSVTAITEILKDVLTCYLQHEIYEAQWSRQMTKTLSEVIRARVNEQMVPRYKVVVVVNMACKIFKKAKHRSSNHYALVNDCRGQYGGESLCTSESEASLGPKHLNLQMACKIFKKAKHCSSNHYALDTGFRGQHEEDSRSGLGNGGHWRRP